MRVRELLEYRGSAPARPLGDAADVHVLVLLVVEVEPLAEAPAFLMAHAAQLIVSIMQPWETTLACAALERVRACVAGATRFPAVAFLVGWNHWFLLQGSCTLAFVGGVGRRGR